MGVPPFLIATSLQGVLAQRLVRRLCSKCAVEEPATEVERELLGLDKGAQLFHPRGCPECSRTGFRGRVGCFEWLQMSESLRDILFQGQSLNRFSAAAAKEGAWSKMPEDISEKILSGLTTVNEMLRVTRVEDEPDEPVKPMDSNSTEGTES
jgi:general secretion pathway protein E